MYICTILERSAFCMSVGEDQGTEITAIQQRSRCERMRTSWEEEWGPGNKDRGDGIVKWVEVVQVVISDLALIHSLPPSPENLLPDVHLSALATYIILLVPITLSVLCCSPPPQLFAPLDCLLRFPVRRLSAALTGIPGMVGGGS